MPIYANSVGLLLVYLAFLAFATKRSLTYLHLYQQEEYDTGRFLRWMMRTRAFDKRLSLTLLALDMLWFSFPSAIFIPLMAIVFAVFAFIEKDPRKASKKKLVMTPRARRILFITLALSALMGLWFFLMYLPLFWILTVQLLPFLLLVANTALTPYENFVQKGFWNDAHRKLTSLKPTVIGITGSFGKTSVKHILGHILKTHAPTLITPGSVNTPMGVTRIIREQLEDNHKFFVVEMGAYGPGSIARLCRLAPPDVGIITAIGHAHYERFKSIETVGAAKFELAQAVLDKPTKEGGGKVIVHEKTLEIEHPRAMSVAKRDHFIVCGSSEINDVFLERIEQLANGLTVSLQWQKQKYVLQVPLYGLHHGHNAALAFAAAVTLGLSPENVITALKSVPQITHRLEVKRQGDTVLIDDAFNSNPEGFKSALELLPVLGGRKILITPGMVELGGAHDEAHEKIGRLAGEICDVALVVQAGRIPSFIRGFKETGADKTLIEVASFSEASAWLDKNRKSGDVVLLENDLPDVYESRLKI